jgi:K+-transporting ATPase ATPase A chain
MTANDYLQLGLYMAVLLLLVKPLGAYMALVFSDTPNRVTRTGAPIERAIYRVCGIQGDEDMSWTRYALVMLAFNVVGLLFVYLLQRVQQWLPLNPQDFPAVSADSAMNTAISFATNTNWQGYGGESTMSYLTQMLGLAVQNFLSAATGIAVLIALIRGFVRRTASGVGNFWVDMTRSTLYILLPAVRSCWRSLSPRKVCRRNFKPYATVPLVEATTASETVKDADGNTVKDAEGKDVTKETKVTEQQLPLGPVASQIAIKQLGTNGGGYYNVNSAHPYENPTPLTDFSRGVGDPADPRRSLLHIRENGRRSRQGWALLIAMLVIFVPCCWPARPPNKPATPRLLH